MKAAHGGQWMRLGPRVADYSLGAIQLSLSAALSTCCSVQSLVTPVASQQWQGLLHGQQKHCETGEMKGCPGHEQ